VEPRFSKRLLSTLPQTTEKKCIKSVPKKVAFFLSIKPADEGMSAKTSAGTSSGNLVLEYKCFIAQSFFT